MALICGGIHRVPVVPGKEGLEDFKRHVREICDMSDNENISYTFGCKVPFTGEHLMLEGESSYNAALHCAKVSTMTTALDMLRGFST